MEILNEYIKFKEDNNNNISKIIFELAWVAFYQYKKKLSFIKKANEEINNFYLIFNGNVTKLCLTFQKEKISSEEYLLYMIKMKLLQEKQILFKCNKLNSAYVDLDLNNFKSYFLENKNYNFKELKQRAKRELIKDGFIFQSNNKIIIPSLDKYLKLSFFQTDDRSDTQTRYHLFIGHYVEVNTISKGNIIGDLSRNEYNEGCTYICDNNSDICYINKIDSVKSKLYDLILQKYIKIFKEIKNKFYILKDTSMDICLNNIVPLMIFKKYKKGEKIIVQNSQYEGIYFIISGEVKISISQTFYELSETLVSLQYSIFNFKDYVSKIIKTIDIIKDFHLKYMQKTQNKYMEDLGHSKLNSDFFSSNEYLGYFSGYKNIEFYNLIEGDIVGLNELFDYKTELYNFTAECDSDEVNLFFLSKKDFNNIMEKESNIMNNVIQLIDLKTKSLIGKINSFRNEYRNSVISNLTYKASKTLNNNIFAQYKTIKNKKFEIRKDLINTITKENDKKINIFRNKNLLLSNYESNNRNKKFIFSSNESNEKKLTNNIKLFKNNELLNYLRDSTLVKSNSITEILKLKKLNKNLLKKKYIYQPKDNNILRTNLTTKNFRKKINLKKDILKPIYISSNYLNYLNEIGNNKVIKKSENEYISNTHSNINFSMNSSPTKIIYNNTTMRIGNGESLLVGVNNNQKRFDSLKIDNYYINNLPLIKGLLKKKENMNKYMGKTDSFKNFYTKHFKISSK